MISSSRCFWIVILTCVLSGFSASQASAHQLWLEPSKEGAALYYGYLDRNLRELSKGRLMEIVQPEAKRITPSGQAQSLSQEAQRDHIALKGGAPVEQDDSVVVVFDNGPVYERDGVGTHWTMASRFVNDETKAKDAYLELDILPTGEPGRFKVMLLGEPLANHRIRLANESGWSMDRNTDADGVVAFPSLPWEGLYVVATNHVVDLEGERERVLADGSTETIEHDRRGFGTTLTFQKSQGLDRLPPLPLSPPYESGTRVQ